MRARIVIDLGSYSGGEIRMSGIIECLQTVDISRIGVGAGDRCRGACWLIILRPVPFTILLHITQQISQHDVIRLCQKRICLNICHFFRVNVGSCDADQR